MSDFGRFTETDASGFRFTDQADSRPESLPESALREGGFSGTITDTLGRERHYVDGKQVATGGGDAGGAGARTGSGGSIPAEHVTAGLAEKVAAADPAAAKSPGLLAKVQDKALTAAAKVYGTLVKLTPAMLKAMEVAGLVFDTPADLQKLGYNPTMAGGQEHAGAAPDALRNATGISTHLAATVASHVLAKAVSYVKGRLAGGKPEAEEGDVLAALAEVLHEALAALAGEFGLAEPPDAATIAANLKKLAGAE